MATSLTGTPISWAINPTMLNMTKPAKKLVALLPNVITKESLQNNRNNKNNCQYCNDKGILFKFASTGIFPYILQVMQCLQRNPSHGI